MANDLQTKLRLTYQRNIVGLYHSLVPEEFIFLERIEGSDLPSPQQPVGKLRVTETGGTLEGCIIAPEWEVENLQGLPEPIRNRQITEYFSRMKYRFYTITDETDVRDIKGILIEGTKPSPFEGYEKTVFRGVILD